MIDIMLLLLTMPPDETFMIFFIILSHLVVRARAVRGKVEPWHVTLSTIATAPQGTAQTCIDLEPFPILTLFNGTSVLS